MAQRAIDIVDRFAPNAKATYRTAFEQGDQLLADYSITTPLRLAHLMAQVMHETGALTILVESGRYGTASLGKMWDSGNWHHYFSDRSDCLGMATQCGVDGGEALLSLVYANRMGNGPPDSHDGWTYRGRGVLQTTGRESYRKYGRSWNVDFEGNPDLIIAPEHALKPALSEWDAGHLNDAADSNDIEVITRRINGGLIGLDERKAWFARIWPFVRDGSTVQHSVEWRVQDALNNKGYRYVKRDGVVGSKTRTAILDYRSKNGLPPGTAIDDALLQSLGLD